MGVPSYKMTSDASSHITHTFIPAPSKTPWIFYRSRIIVGFLEGEIACPRTSLPTNGVLPIG